MSHDRHTPEEFLAAANATARQENTGKLKIFLGAAPGVGKTYTMLQTANSKLEERLDVVAGIIETHQRKKTAELLENIEVLPRLTVSYRGRKLQEFDLDAALRRHPAIVLVDEMAHRNAPGCRHAKRWQDIEELLDRGIDVYTTLNVQHIESLNDVVAQITGVRVSETVPDSMLERADNIELVDLPPDDLLKRLQEGKVYFPQQAELASEHFFQKSNLTALRELALRVTTERVNAQMLAERRDQATTEPWATVERLLVCVGPGPNSAKVIRAAKRLSNTLNAKWIAVFVDAPRLRLRETQRYSALQNLRLAETLGAETQTLTGLDLVKEITQFARERNVSKIVIGKYSRSWWRYWLFDSLVDELVRHSADIDIYIIRGDESPASKTSSTPEPATRKSCLRAYINCFLAVIVCTAINIILYRTILVDHDNLSNVLMTYLLGVILVATQGWRGPAILTSILSGFSADYFFIPPLYSLGIANTKYLINLLIMIALSQIVSHLTITIRQQAIIAKSKEQNTYALYSLTEQLAKSRTQPAILNAAVQCLADIFASDILVLLSDENRHLHMQASFPIQPALEPKEYSIAQWAFDAGQKAGLGTQTLSDSAALYFPLIGAQQTIGVLRLHPRNPQRFSTLESLHLLEALAQQLTLALEVERLQENS